MTSSQSLGERYDPFGEHLQDPYPFYAKARSEEPVFFSPVVNAWVITRHDDVRAALQEPEVFSSANALRPLTRLHPATIAELQQGYPPVLEPITSDGELHRRLRTPVARGLSARRVDGAEPFIRRRAEELVAAFADDGHAELMSRYAYRLPVEVIAHLFGLDPEDTELALKGSYGGIMMVAARKSEAEQAQAARDMVTFQQRCGHYVRARRAEPKDDLVSEVVAALAPGDEPADGQRSRSKQQGTVGRPLTFEQESEIAQVLMGVFLAGHVTTAALIGNGVRHLLTDRQQWELLCARPELIGDAVEEIARFDTPVQGFLRVTTRPVTVGGVELPAGTEVLLAYGSANHDPALGDRPDTFDVTRAPTRHLAFGAGMHTCAGAGLARRELAVTLQTLTRRLPSLRLVDGEQVTINTPMTGHGPTSLRVAW